MIATGKIWRMNAQMSEPNGYLIHGTAFSSKEAAFKALVSNHDQESWFHKIWDEDAQPYYFESQPQLTIPKSIADEIDCVVNPIGQIVLKSGILSDFTVEAISWIYKNNENGYIAIAYANPLTRDLVKVVADD